VILEYAKEGKHQDKKSLIEYIESNKPTNFLSSWRNRETDIIEHRYSTNSIERAIKICVDLKLLQGESMVLTPHGRSATDPRRFPTIVGGSVRELLESLGIPFNLILNSIRSILHSDQPRPSTSEEIWNQLGRPAETINEEEFQSLLALLGQCHILSVTQKRMFLPWYEDS
jgi:hypothetical protein